MTLTNRKRGPSRGAGSRCRPSSSPSPGITTACAFPQASYVASFLLAAVCSCFSEEVNVMRGPCTQPPPRLPSARSVPGYSAPRPTAVDALAALPSPATPAFALDPGIPAIPPCLSLSPALPSPLLYSPLQRTPSSLSSFFSPVDSGSHSRQVFINITSSNCSSKVTSEWWRCQCSSLSVHSSSSSSSSGQGWPASLLVPGATPSGAPAALPVPSWSPRSLNIGELGAQSKKPLLSSTYAFSLSDLIYSRDF